MPGDDRDHTNDLHDRRGQPNLDHPRRQLPTPSRPSKDDEHGIGDQELRPEEPKDRVAVPLTKPMLLFSEEASQFYSLSTFLLR